VPSAIILPVSPLPHLRELSLEPLIGFVRRAELLERLAGVGRTHDLGQNIRRFGWRLRQLDIDADAGIGEAAGLYVAGIGEHGLGELHIGLGQRLRAHSGKIRSLVVVHVEAVGVGVLEPRDHGFGAGGLDAFIEPQRR
jgi:hypothetical protein